MNIYQKEFFLDHLRSSRAVALADAEGFQAIIRALELMGQRLKGRVGGLTNYRKKLSELAKNSTLANDIPSEWPEFHTQFSTLYEDMRTARNDAVHQGAHARILANHAVELTIILEDALMSESSLVSQFMVRDVVEAEMWHPVSFVRQQMLKNAFSYLPILKGRTWMLIAEFSVAHFLRNARSSKPRSRRLATPVRSAFAMKELRLLKAKTCPSTATVAEIVEDIRDRPILVVDPKRDNALVGLLTSSDII